jgi:ubiquinone biosynthesis protein
LLPELPRLVHQNLAHTSNDIRKDLALILHEQRRTNRALSGLAWAAMGFVAGMVVAQLLLRLHISHLF